MEFLLNHPWLLGLVTALLLSVAIEARYQTAVRFRIQEDTNRKDQMVAIRDGLFIFGIGTVVSMIVGLWMLGIAMRTLPVGTPYGVWVGIGAVGTVTLGIVLLGESASPVRLISVGLICCRYRWSQAFGVSPSLPDKQRTGSASSIRVRGCVSMERLRRLLTIGTAIAIGACIGGKRSERASG
jgi:multidrug transporter EmrE-like cation transporter